MLLPISSVARNDCFLFRSALSVLADESFDCDLMWRRTLLSE